MPCHSSVTTVTSVAKGSEEVLQHGLGPVSKAPERFDVPVEGGGGGVRGAEIVGGWYVVYEELLLFAEYMSWC
jgi:hypothetical protein